MLKASVIICTHLVERIDHLNEAISSIVNQTYPNIEITVVVDGSEELYKKINNPNVYPILNSKNIGLSLSRNRGASVSTGDVIIFFDDDAFAEPNWVEELMRMYTEYNAISSGGRTIPDWMGNKAEYLPDEYLWLVGASHKGMPENIREIDNGFGSNISFLRQVFIELGGFTSTLGFNNKKILQGEELELCLRMREKYNQGVMFNPNAIIRHKVFGDRTKISVLLRRAFYQGYSKRQIKETSKAKLSTENVFLKNILFNAIPNNVYRILLLFLLTASVGLGYLYRTVKK